MMSCVACVPPSHASLFRSTPQLNPHSKHGGTEPTKIQVLQKTERLQKDKEKRNASTPAARCPAAARAVPHALRAVPRALEPRLRDRGCGTAAPLRCPRLRAQSNRTEWGARGGADAKRSAESRAQVNILHRMKLVTAPSKNETFENYDTNSLL